MDGQRQRFITAESALVVLIGAITAGCQRHANPDPSGGRKENALARGEEDP